MIGKTGQIMNKTREKWSENSVESIFF